MLRFPWVLAALTLPSLSFGFGGAICAGPTAVTNATISPSTVSASQCLRSDSAGTHFFAGPGCGSSEAVFNEASGAVDFRVESDGNANMLKIDGTNNRVGIGISPSTVRAEILTNADGTANAGGLSIWATDQATNGPYLNLNKNAGVATIGSIQSGDNSAGAPLSLNPNGGNVGVGTASPETLLDVAGAAQFGSTAKSTFTAAGNLALAGGATPFTVGTSTFAIASGRVGIGTASPGVLFHIQGNNATNARIFSNSATGSTSLAIGRTASDLDAATVGAAGDFISGSAQGDAVIRSNSGALWIGPRHASGTLEFFTTTSGNRRLSIANAGNVGINDTTPDAQLEVLSKSAAGGFVVAISSQNDTTGNILSILGDGSVGIGQPTPVVQLDVVSTTQGLGIPSLTTTQVQASTPGRAGALIYNSTISAVCVSTGTTVQGYSLVSSSAACQ